MCSPYRLRGLGQLIVIAALLWATFSVGVAKTTAQASNCSGAPASRLTVGSEVHITPGAANNLRDKPARSGRILTEVPGDTYVFVLDGPQCADNLAWWKVYYDQVGWMAEGNGNDYFIEPATSQTITFEVESGKVFVSYHTVSFVYRGSFGKYVQAHAVPAAQGSVDAPVDITAPEYVEFGFTDIQPATPDPNAAHESFLLVYPAKEFEAMNRDAKTKLPALKELLKTTPKSIDEDIPFQPTQYAAQVFHSNVAYLQFKTGAGIRFLTKWTQGMDWIVSQGLRYAFEGFSEGDSYFLTAMFAIKSSLLADTGSEDQDFAAIDYSTGDEGAAQIKAYKAKIVAKLNAASSNDFKPPLDGIDALIQSISVVTIKG